ncbi:MAG: hypothetical protein CM15mP111_0340 [Hyphomicrobiales bacterium]|nr:MAG: hypothetical protein CM15mP111_0340 [Hyphomicrobiales bacterium]
MAHSLTLADGWFIACNRYLWKRVNHPSDLLKIGQSVKVQVTKINAESKKS